ncbi:MAG TPA: TlpA disulfide reductase family protein, partial [Chthoniobacteraceae bacterium]|nr:TlpA disulfide reductase family protein [Chthoniobacteraceae bacterium]
KLPDVAYDRLTLLMHHAQDPDETEREALLSQVLKFQKDYPTDHRNGDLLVAVATAYDDDPQKERDLLNQAIRYANADLKAEISDDLKRLEMVGRPLKLKFDSVQGQEINIESYRGKVVLIYFFAGGSPPSVMGLGPVKEIADGLARTGEFQLLAISLDDKKEMLDTILKRTGLNCPVYFDGKGWDSALPRSLGINRLPTVWLVDKHGNLRVLNAINNTEALVRGLMREEQ